MRTISPDEAISIAKRTASDFEAGGDTDPRECINAFFVEIEPALAHDNVDRDDYLSSVASKIKLEVAAPDPERARRSGFFTALLREISTRRDNETRRETLRDQQHR